MRELNYLNNSLIIISILSKRIISPIRLAPRKEFPPDVFGGAQLVGAFWSRRNVW